MAAKKSAKSAKNGYDDGVCGDPSVVFAGPQPIEKHLLNRLVVGHQDMPDGMAAYEMANLFRQVFGMIARAFEGLGHEDDLQTGVALYILGILNMPQKDEIPQAVDLCVSAQHVDRPFHITG